MNSESGTPDGSSALDRPPFHGASVLVTGGTGSVGRRLVGDLLSCRHVKKVVVLSRDDLKQAELRAEFPDSRLHCVIDDVASPIRLQHSCENADVIIHAAAMKTVQSCESAPERAISINVMGTANVLAAGAAARVPLVIGISSDKAVQPVNVYGSTKLLTERLFQSAAERYPGSRLVSVRLCNVAGSRGGIIARLLSASGAHSVKLTHPGMTRFFISDGDVSQLVGACAGQGASGEIFVPRARSVRIQDLIEVMTVSPAVSAAGSRHGERLFEWLVGSDDYLLRTETTHFVVSSRAAGNATTAGPEPRFRSDSASNLMTRRELVDFLLGCGLLSRGVHLAAASDA